MSTLALRDADGEWCHLHQAGELEGVGWVDARLDLELEGGRQVLTSDGYLLFRHRALLRTLPRWVAESAVDAQKRGEVTAWEALQLVFARMEWLIRTRRHLWAPWSPVPRLLASLVETFGVEPQIHRYDPDRLSRLAALLPAWHPHRGTLKRAVELLATADEGDALAGAADLEGSTQPDAPRLGNEVLVVHGIAWWRHRAAEGAEPMYRISGGLVRFQPRSGPSFNLTREDVLFAWTPGTALPQNALRLLPAWTVVRLTAPTS